MPPSRTVLVCEAQVPFVHGGAELHVRGLVCELTRRGYRAERVSVAFVAFSLRATVTGGRFLEDGVGLMFMPPAWDAFRGAVHRRETVTIAPTVDNHRITLEWIAETYGEDAIRATIDEAKANIANALESYMEVLLETAVRSQAAHEASPSVKAAVSGTARILVRPKFEIRA